MTASVSLLVLSVLCFDRLLSSRRPQLLAPAGALWLRTRPRIAAYIRSSPVTYGYLVILFVTSWILAGLGDRLGDRLLLEQSTNLDNLGHDPVRVLLSSAFWLPGGRDLVISALLFTLVLAPVERRIGPWRTIGLFAIGHVGATLLTGAGLWIALHFDAVEPSVVHVRDVGTSYGFYAVAAGMTYLARRHLRRPYLAALVGYLSIAAALSGDFGDYGHLTAMALGFAGYPLVARASGRMQTPILGNLPKRAGRPVLPRRPCRSRPRHTNRARTDPERVACFGCTDVRMESCAPPLWAMVGRRRGRRWWDGRVVWGSSAS